MPSLPIPVGAAAQATAGVAQRTASETVDTVQNQLTELNLRGRFLSFIMPNQTNRENLHFAKEFMWYRLAIIIYVVGTLVGVCLGFILSVVAGFNGGMSLVLAILSYLFMFVIICIAVWLLLVFAIPEPVRYCSIEDVIAFRRELGDAVLLKVFMGASIVVNIILFIMACFTGGNGLHAGVVGFMTCLLCAVWFWGWIGCAIVVKGSLSDERQAKVEQGASKNLVRY